MDNLKDCIFVSKLIDVIVIYIYDNSKIVIYLFKDLIF